MTQLLFLDVEATGVDAEDRLLQVAYKIGDEVVNELFKPPVKIKLPAMAVHHVTEKMVAEKPAFKDSKAYQDLTAMFYRAHNDQVVLVAHNAKYDVGMLAKEGIEVPRVICTYKLAKYLDNGQFENHQMQYLRYYYGIDIQATAHDALGDIMVLEQVFGKLMKDLVRKDFPNILLVGDEVLQRIIEISTLPSLVRKFTFGKYIGKTIEEVVKKDKGYLQWLLEQKKAEPAGQEDWLYTLNYWLNK